MFVPSESTILLGVLGIIGLISTFTVLSFSRYYYEKV